MLPLVAVSNAVGTLKPMMKSVWLRILPSRFCIVCRLSTIPHVGHCTAIAHTTAIKVVRISSVRSEKRNRRRVEAGAVIGSIVPVPESRTNLRVQVVGATPFGTPLFARLLCQLASRG